MGFFDDWEGYKKRWKSSSLIEKAAVLVLLFGTTGSFASLSDNVFKWKGFILEGVIFYQNVIREGFKNIFGWINLDFSDTEADILILTNLILSSLSRIADQNLKIEDVDPKTKKEALIMLWSSIFYSILIFALLSRERDYANWIYIVILSLATFRMVVATFEPIYGGRYLTIRERIFELWGPIIFAIIIVLILAAINTGLSKPLS